MTRERIDDLARSERHFTSGLLMHLLLSHELLGVDAFMDLLVERGILDQLPVRVPSKDEYTQVIAEFATRRDLAAATGQADETLPRDVVDVVLVVGDVLIAIEAKFFTRPTVSEVRDQLATQRRALEALVAEKRFGVSRILQVFLEHGRSLDASKLHCEGVLQWSDIYEIACGLLRPESYAAERIAAAMARCDGERKPRRMPYCGRGSFDEVLALCRARGEIRVGYDGGEKKLRACAQDDLTSRRHWKWCEPADAPKTGNWLEAKRFLAIVDEITARDGSRRD